MSAGHETFMVFVNEFLEALDRLVERKKPISMAPINKLREMIESPGTASINASILIRSLVDAGYNVDDIREFLLDAGIIRDMDEWVRLKIDVERAIIKAKIEKETGGEFNE
jgi:hypothetical protein